MRTCIIDAQYFNQVSESSWAIGGYVIRTISGEGGEVIFKTGLWVLEFRKNVTAL